MHSCEQILSYLRGKRGTSSVSYEEPQNVIGLQIKSATRCQRSAFLCPHQVWIIPKNSVSSRLKYTVRNGGPAGGCVLWICCSMHPCKSNQTFQSTHHREPALHENQCPDFHLAQEASSPTNLPENAPALRVPAPCSIVILQFIFLNGILLHLSKSYYGTWHQGIKPLASKEEYD